MAFLVKTAEKCKDLATLSKYTVFFFHTPDSTAAAAAAAGSPTAATAFRAQFAPLLKMVRGKSDFKCGQFSTEDVAVPRERFGFSSDSGIIFYRNGVYLTYMSSFDAARFEHIVNNIDAEPYAAVNGVVPRA
ncbi:hypothetical protein H4S06_005098 [Coemansia sp. BCRC 34490]|nr:hypothetical protein H4S06_005098 [Coemansia sp. BCRC 34490]